jgi:hypothetical protein
MSDGPKTHADAVATHGRDLHKVGEQLKNLVASLRSEKERLEAEARQHAASPAPGAPDGPGGAPQRDEVARLADELARAREAIAQAGAERDRLEARLGEIERENQRICDEYVAVQERATELAELFVTLERIHGGRTRAETLAAVQEIVINVVGSEELAILERRGDALVLAQSFGVDPEPLRAVSLGEGAIGRAAATGELYVAGRQGPPAPGEEDLTAAIPLTVGGEVAGVVAIYRLLGHKPGLSGSDEAIFRLLGEHAGVALRLRAERAVAG